MDDAAASEAAWALLEDHFQYHAALMSRFKNAHPLAVLRMWRRGTNEFGEPLSQFEGETIVERYCELFGGWPTEMCDRHLDRLKTGREVTPPRELESRACAAASVADPTARRAVPTRALASPRAARA